MPEKPPSQNPDRHPAQQEPQPGTVAGRVQGPPRPAPPPGRTGPVPGHGPPAGRGPRDGHGPAHGYAPMRGGAAHAYGPSPTHHVPRMPGDVDAVHALPTEAFPAAQAEAPAARTAGALAAAAQRSVASASASAAEKREKRDLTVNKVIAGAGAAATSAVLGSFFGAMGTIGGAAVGSVVSMLSTSLLEHSLDKTRDTVKAKVKLPGGRTIDVEGPVTVPPPVAPEGEVGRATVYVTPGDQPTEVLSVVPAADAAPARSPWSRRRVFMLAGFTVLVFAIAMLAVTGIELIKGSPLNSSGTAGSGTSVGRVLTSGGGATDAPADTGDESATESAVESEAPADEDGAESTAEEQPAPAGRDSAEDAEPSSAPSRGPAATPTVESGADGNPQSGGGAADGAASEAG
jgi:hypothetical protein